MEFRTLKRKQELTMREKRYKEEIKLEELVGREGGWQVPDNYFSEAIAEIKGKLPEYPVERVAPKMTMRQKMRPYLYLAAMFAGIWLMMQVFFNISESRRINLDNVPERIAMIMESSENNDINGLSHAMLYDYELENEVYANYTDFDEFRRDFESTAN